MWWGDGTDPFWYSRTSVALTSGTLMIVVDVGCMPLNAIPMKSADSPAWWRAHASKQERNPTKGKVGGGGRGRALQWRWWRSVRWFRTRGCPHCLMSVSRQPPRPPSPASFTAAPSHLEHGRLLLRVRHGAEDKSEKRAHARRDQHVLARALGVAHLSVHRALEQHARRIELRNRVARRAKRRARCVARRRAGA